MTGQPSPQPIPRTPVAPYLIVRGADEAISFYAIALGMTETFRLSEPGGKVGHAELSLEGGVIMLADEYPDFGALAPPSIGGSPVSILIQVASADAAFQRAVDAGCTATKAPRDEFYGDRSAGVMCPFGYRWTFNEPRTQLTPDEMQQRWTTMLEAGQYE
jgi:PhnB protein